MNAEIEQVDKTKRKHSAERSLVTTKPPPYMSMKNNLIEFSAHLRMMTSPKNQMRLSCKLIEKRGKPR